jgi:hypothetical protein
MPILDQNNIEPFDDIKLLNMHSRLTQAKADKDAGSEHKAVLIGEAYMSGFTTQYSMFTHIADGYAKSLNDEPSSLKPQASHAIRQLSDALDEHIGLPNNPETRDVRLILLVTMNKTNTYREIEGSRALDGLTVVMNRTNRSEFMPRGHQVDMAQVMAIHEKFKNVRNQMGKPGITAHCMFEGQMDDEALGQLSDHQINRQILSVETEMREMGLTSFFDNDFRELIFGTANRDFRIDTEMSPNGRLIARMTRRNELQRIKAFRPERDFTGEDLNPHPGAGAFEDFHPANDDALNVWIEPPAVRGFDARARDQNCIV